MNTPNHKKVGDNVPDSQFPIRVNDTWQTLASSDIFANKTVAVFALPGVFTPTCSKSHLPGFSAHAQELFAAGIDKIYCLSVNDWFVMEAWRKDLNVGDEVTMLPDGNMDFSVGMGLLVEKRSLGFGNRSWRYSMIVKDSVIDAIFVEDFNDPGDPFRVSGAPQMLEFLNS